MDEKMTSVVEGEFHLDEDLHGGSLKNISEKQKRFEAPIDIVFFLSSMQQNKQVWISQRLHHHGRRSSSGKPPSMFEGKDRSLGKIRHEKRRLSMKNEEILEKIVSSMCVALDVHG